MICFACRRLSSFPRLYRVGRERVCDHCGAAACVPLNQARAEGWHPESEDQRQIEARIADDRERALAWERGRRTMRTLMMLIALSALLVASSATAAPRKHARPHGTQTIAAKSGHGKHGR